MTLFAAATVLAVVPFLLVAALTLRLRRPASDPAPESTPDLPPERSLLTL